jgi:hypothetical protein
MTTDPTFFLIGAARSGTTALARALQARPGVFVTEPKEPHYLALAGTVPHFTGPGDEATVNRLSVTDRDAYRALYDHAASFPVRGEASVSTMYYAEQSIATIQREFPDVRMVAVLRNPVDRAYSAFQYLRARGFEPLEDFEAALDSEDSRVAAGWHHLWHYTHMGLYGEQLTAFYDAFGRDRLLVLDYDDFAADEAAVVGRIAAFIGAPAAETNDGDTMGRVNRSGQHKYRLVAATQRAFENHPGAKAMFRRVVPRRVRDRMRNAALADVPMTSSARQRLEAFYAADRATLAALVPDVLSFAR